MLRRLGRAFLVAFAFFVMLCATIVTSHWSSREYAQLPATFFWGLTAVAFCIGYGVALVQGRAWLKLSGLLFVISFGFILHYLVTERFRYSPLYFAWLLVTGGCALLCFAPRKLRDDKNGGPNEPAV